MRSTPNPADHAARRVVRFGSEYCSWSCWHAAAGSGNGRGTRHHEFRRGRIVEDEVHAIRDQVLGQRNIEAAREEESRVIGIIVELDRRIESPVEAKQDRDQRVAIVADGALSHVRRNLSVDALGEDAEAEVRRGAARRVRSMPRCVVGWRPFSRRPRGRGRRPGDSRVSPVRECDADDDQPRRGDANLAKLRQV